MRFITLLLIAGAYVLVSGCAAQPAQKRALTDAEHVQVAKTLAAMNVCGNSGKVAPDLIAVGNLSMQQMFSWAIYDRARLSQDVDSYIPQVDDQDCTILANFLATVRLKKETQQRQAAVNSMQESQAAPLYQYSTPKRTICNNIAGQILCSTY